MPDSIEEVKDRIYKKTPILIEPKRAYPTPEITNAGLALFENPIRRSHSFFEIFPEIYKSREILTPKGKPQRSPIAKAEMAYPLILNRRENARRKGRINSKCIYESIRSASIEKGKIEGIIAV